MTSPVSPPVTTCTVCGGTAFAAHTVLWDGLANEWQLAAHERAYIDRQQGFCCTACGANLRSMALANAIRAAVATKLTLDAFAATAPHHAILEINEAGSLGPILRKCPNHILAAYPAVDMHALPYPDGQFDLVVHSDTLEHVAAPVHALAECRRVLRPGGTLCFTVPTIVGRMSRSREGLPASYHGDPATATPDMLVQTEFGADMWTFPLQAGFDIVTIHAVAYPAGLAIAAQTTP